MANYAEVAAQVGLDASAMLRLAGIDRRALADPDMRITADSVVELLEASADAARCPTFGLRMAESRQLSDFGAISLLITHQATMRDALKTLVQYRQILNPSLLVQMEEHGDVVVVREELAVRGHRSMRQAYDLAIGVLYRLFRAVLGSRWRAASVNFTHAAPDDLLIHRRVFGPICEFGSDFNGLTCSRADLDAPNPTADPILARHAERYLRTLPGADGRTLSQEIQKAIYLLLPVGEVSIGRVAASLGFNERTLQRRLVAEGADYTAVLNDVRRELTLRYVANEDLPLARIAGLVGYARQSSFNRWFAEEFGAAPGRWRREAHRRAGGGEL
ncbi:AraC family transcriptional regulator [Phenylobacterium sp.]|uniref:AraC family transcriptional regulator n=1 Tax=Phenylobacterium sp. TaxID=1871053 RepID=UPI002E355420|nr:AraC family transcriptional regulator [Phenylobacterium sp.]HEX3365308.1 AraC family transcriptional regulator [Phenylobacterium sp.]